MDEGLKLFYKAFMHIDPDNCLLVPREYGKLELEVNGKREPFREFVDHRTRIVSITHASNKEIADTGPDFAKHAYFTLIWHHAATELDGKIIGIAEQVMVYNGLPAAVKTKDLIENPQEAWKKGIEKLIQRNNPRDIKQKPEEYTYFSYWLSPEFLEQNPLYRVTRIWSFKLSEEKIEWFK